MTELATVRQPSLARRRAAGGTGLGLALAVAGVATGTTAAHAAEVTVEPGDTVSHIALRTGSSVSAIVRANALDARATIRAGQRLVVPTGSDAASPAPAAPAAPQTHTVVQGDTVWDLAQRYGTSVEAMVAANGLDSRALIRAGQVLAVPGVATATGVTTVSATRTGSSTASTPTSTSTSTSTVQHNVRAGETVSGIATRYGTTVKTIVGANGLDARAFITVGQTLEVPSSGAAAPATTGTPLVGSTFAGRTYPAATVASANANKATLLEIGVPSKDEMQTLVRDTALALGVDPSLAQAVAYQESGFDQSAVSPANAIGTMQVIPTSGAWASQLVGRELNLLDPRDNVTAGVAILRQLVATSTDLPTAIAGYYQGQAGVRKYGMYPDTRRYVANVQTLMSRYA